MTPNRKWILPMMLAAAVVLLALAAVAFFYPQKLLCVDSGPVRADVIVLLGGGMGERPGVAAELYREQSASRIIISGLGDSEINERALLKSGVPRSAIEIEGESRTTKENAEFTIRLLRREHVQNVILVTSWYHSRRALRCFEHYAPEIDFYSRPSYFAVARADWPQKKVERRIYLEYAKLAGYWLRYGVSPF